MIEGSEIAGAEACLNLKEFMCFIMCSGNMGQMIMKLVWQVKKVVKI